MQKRRKSVAALSGTIEKIGTNLEEAEQVSDRSLVHQDPTGAGGAALAPSALRSWSLVGRSSWGPSHALLAHIEVLCWRAVTVRVAARQLLAAHGPGPRSLTSCCPIPHACCATQVQRLHAERWQGWAAGGVWGAPVQQLGEG